MSRHFIRELSFLLAAIAAPCAVGAITAWLFEGIAFFFGSLFVVAAGTVVGLFMSFRVRDNFGPPWGFVSFLLVLIGGGYLGLATIMWITTPFDK